MNVYLAVILVSLVGSWLLGLLSNILSARHLRPELPREFGDVFDAKTYRKSQNYTRASMHFTNVASTFNVALTLIVILAGGFNWLDLAVRSFELSPLLYMQDR